MLPKIRALWIVALALAGPPLAAQTCREIDELPGNPGLLSAVEQRFVDDFGAAVGRFRGMSLEEFIAEYGPRKNYRVPGPLSFRRGDTNDDGALGLADATCIIAYLFAGSGPCVGTNCEDRLDVDDSGEIQITDALYLLNHLFVGGPRPAAPFDEEGLDPTADDLTCAKGLLDYDPLRAENFELITAHYPLTGAQEEAYRESGFVILQDRKFETFFHALDATYNQHLPIYISADTLLDALHLSFDELLLTIEQEMLIGDLEVMLEKMEEGIDGLRQYDGGLDIEEDLDDIASWICTARSLLRGGKTPCARRVDPAVTEFLDHVSSEKVEEITLFRAPVPCEPHLEDFSQFRPRGHYTRSKWLERYFRAMMWVQRIGAQWLHRGARQRWALSDSHAVGAYLLSRLLIDSGAWEEWERINAVVELFVGASDSLNAPGMVDLAERAGVRSVADLYDQQGLLDFVGFAQASGAGRQLINSQILFADPTAPEGFTPLPPAFHLMGQRFIVDSFIFTNVTCDRVPTGACGCGPPIGNGSRAMPSPLDAFFALGNRATVPLLLDGLEEYGYQENLAAVDWIVSRYPEEFWSRNLYNIWLSALRTLSADTTSERYPAVMRSLAWDRRMLQTQVSSWAHLRHDTILYAKQSYTVGECDYPEGWVDPYPEFFARLAEFAERAESDLEGLGIFDFEGEPIPFNADVLENDTETRREVPPGAFIQRYFRNLASHSRMLEGIARRELEGLELDPGQKRFLKNTLKEVPGGRSSGFLPSYNGWYPDLVFGFTFDGACCTLPNLPAFQPTIADVHTYYDSCADETYFLEAGVGHPNLMLISVDTTCGTKSYVGPVLSYHEFIAEDQRLTDEEWTARLLELQPGEPPRPAWTDAFVR